MELTLNPAGDWAGRYIDILDRRIETSLHYLQSAPPHQVAAHLRSFLSLLSESHRYSHLTPPALRLISALHPLPLRLGLGLRWEAELRFALSQTDQDSAQAAKYRCDLADVYLFSGKFEQAINTGQQVLDLPVPANLWGRAGRVMFLSLRAGATLPEAETLLERVRRQALGGLSPDHLSPAQLEAWLRLSQCELELLRDRGRVDDALALVEDMLARAGVLPSDERALHADLYTHRSTLLWVRGKYHRAVADLNQAVALFEQDGDTFNAVSLESNLGLVYWTMGDLNRAEVSLRRAIQFYRASGMEQLITYDTGNLGLVYFGRGDLAQALALTREHIALAQKLGFQSEYHRGRRNLGTILYYFDQIDQAEAELNAAHAYYETRGSRDAYGLDNLWLALCLLARGKAEEARRLVLDTIAWSASIRSAVLEQAGLRCLAYLLPPEEQIEPLTRSLELVQATERRLEEAAVRLALAAAGVQDAAAHRQAAEQALVEIGAERWLDGRDPEQPPFIPMLF